MKIIFVLPGLAVSGGVRVVYEFANRLQQRNHQVAVASIDGETAQNWFPLQVPIISRHQLIKQAEQTDAVVATGWQTAPICLSLPAKARVYFVQSYETLFYREFRSQIDAYSTYPWPFDGFITVSRWVQRILREEFQQDSVMAPQMVNRDMFYPEPRFPKNGRVRVLIEGPHTHIKGIKEAYAAVAGLPVEVWSLSQQGPLGPVHRSFVLPSQEMIRQIYSSCDILLKTSWYEGRPLSHVEAMACGCALISSDMYGVDDLIDGYNALIIPARDIEAARAALVRLIENPALRQQLIEGGLETVRRQDWEKSLSQMEAGLASAVTRATAHSTQQVSETACPVHVVLINEAGREQAHRSLTALRSAMPPDKLSISVIHKGDYPDTLDYFREANLPVLERNSEHNYAGIWHQVVDQAGNRPIVLLSTLIRIDRPDWIRQLLAQLESGPDTGLVGVKLVDSAWTIESVGGSIGPAPEWARDYHINYHGRHEAHFYHNQRREVEWIDNHCLIISSTVARGLLAENGHHPFDESIVPYCLEARRQGWRVVYFPQVIAWVGVTETSAQKFDFEDLADIDAKERRMIARQRGVSHYVRVFRRDLNKYGLRQVLKRSWQWLRWFLLK